MLRPFLNALALALSLTAGPLWAALDAPERPATWASPVKR